MIALSFTVDTSELRGLRALFRASLRRGVEAVGREGVKVVGQEIPRRSRRLADGVDFEMSPGDSRLLRGDITVSAIREAEPAGTAVLHLAGGGTRPVKIAAQRAYDYAEAVARGTGLYGPRGQLIKPRAARALRIEVESVAPGESFVSHQGRLFVYRRFSKGMRPDNYDERAARRLLDLAPDIVDLALAPLSR